MSYITVLKYVSSCYSNLLTVHESTHAKIAQTKNSFSLEYWRNVMGLFSFEHSELENNDLFSSLKLFFVKSEELRFSNFIKSKTNTAHFRNHDKSSHH